MEITKSNLIGTEFKPVSTPAPKPAPIIIEPPEQPAPQPKPNPIITTKPKGRMSKKRRRELREHNKRASMISFRPTKQNSLWLKTKENKTEIIQDLLTSKRQEEQTQQAHLNEIKNSLEGKGNYDFVQEDFDNTQNENKNKK